MPLAPAHQSHQGLRFELIVPRQRHVRRLGRLSRRPQAGQLLLKVEMVGLCGTDLNSFRGRNPLITYPRILGHEIAATVLEGNATTPAGTRVTVSPYTACGRCPSCRRGRENACR